MAIPKAPRAKPAGRASAKAKTEPALPDRRAMEDFLAALGDRGRDRDHGPRADDLTAKAQHVIYDAWEQRTKQSRVALAREALRLSPLCADAYVILASETARSAEERRDLFERGVEAGELALGPEGFEEYAGSFWGFLETRPYMRARAGLADALLTLGDTDGAVAHWRAMLELNPNDNQGVRYLLAAELLRRGDMLALKTLLTAYKAEGSMFWLYTRALVAFREGKGGAKATRALLQSAAEANPHVPGILSGAAPAVSSRGGYVTMGGADEATWYVEECGPAWHATPGAVAWLGEHVAAHERSTPRWGRDIQ